MINDELQIKDDIKIIVVKEKEIDVVDSEQLFPLISHEQIQLLKENSLLCEQLDQKLLSLCHEPHYEWLGQQLPDLNVSGPQQIRVFVVTWNMHGLMIGSQLQKLLRSDDLRHHVVVFGSQECQRSISQSIFCDSKEEWENQIFRQLGKNYSMVASNKLNAIHLCVFAHVSIVSLIDERKIGKIATGFFNLVGNKGAVAISVKIGSRKFLFINNHLASGQHVQAKRNKEFLRIKTEFPIEKNSQSVEKRFDYTFWIGDFNSRIDDLNINRENLSQFTFFELLMKDQFLHSRHHDEMYQYFKEGMIHFPPSYKLVENDNKFASSKDWRIPGWTDRILFHENEVKAVSPTKIKMGQIQHFNEEDSSKPISKNKIILVNYDSATSVWGSDHRPVFAQFLITI